MSVRDVILYISWHIAILSEIEGCRHDSHTRTGLQLAGHFSKIFGMLLVADCLAPSWPAWWSSARSESTNVAVKVAATASAYEMGTATAAVVVSMMAQFRGARRPQLWRRRVSFATVAAAPSASLTEDDGCDVGGCPRRRWRSIPTYTAA